MNTDEATPGPVFVISGVSAGLGEALCSHLLGMGRAVVGIGRSFTTAQIDAAEMQSCKLMHCDLSSLDDLEGLSLETVLDGHDEVVFLSNAGTVEPVGLVGQSGLADIATSFHVNYLAPAAIASAIIRATATGGARLTFVNISSGAARRPIPGWSAYCAGKAAASAYFKCIAAERPEIRVIERDPGVMDTGMQAAIRSHTPAQFPPHDDFMRLKTDNKLLDPKAVAAALLEEIGSG
jgi:benzil reductase ((S)-benzoin forming)